MWFLNINDVRADTTHVSDRDDVRADTTHVSDRVLDSGGSESSVNSALRGLGSRCF
jgi:hypothetical protein